MSLGNLLRRILPKRFVDAVHEKRKARRRADRRRDLEASAPRYSAEDLAEGIAALGVGEGDLVIAWSSLSQLGWVEGGPDAVVDALLSAVGEQGTLVMPAFLVHRTDQEIQCHQRVESEQVGGHGRRAPDQYDAKHIERVPDVTIDPAYL